MRLARRPGAVALAAAAFFAGLSLDHVARAADEERWRALDVFAHVLAHVENLYVDRVPDRELV